MSAASPAPVLVIAVGNPSRGDDALGPMLLERLAPSVPAVELLGDFQLQVEHALDLADRFAVLFVDAALPGTCARGSTAGCADGVSLEPVSARVAPVAASHALSADAVLQVCSRLHAAVPACWQLAIEGCSFALGEGLSAPAKDRLDRAEQLARTWIRAQCDAVAAGRPPAGSFAP